MDKILIIQTAFLGDVILATGVLEKLHAQFPNTQLDFVVRKGNEGLLEDHPFIHELYVWDKSNKYKSLFSIIKQIRKKQYDVAINIQRFGASGFMTLRSKAKHKIGFDKNPFSRFFDLKVPHEITNGTHEVERNHALIVGLTDKKPGLPKLYPNKTAFQKVKQFKEKPFVCIAPSSVWFTKQVPEHKWVELVNQLTVKVYLIGAPSDLTLAERIKEKSQNKNVSNLCGELNLLESVALIHDAEMNYVNDSGPMHMASSVNAPTTAFYCSTDPKFGFGPLSKNSQVIEVTELTCKPCGLHGHTACPKGNFRCGNELKMY